MDSTIDVKRTPLYDTHVALGARMMVFGGFDMPVQYTSIVEEHMAVRRAAGLFDVSHMGEVMVRGPKAFDFVQHLVTNDAASLYDGRAMYTVMCLPSGGIVDDLLVYRLSQEEYMLVVNASNIEKDFAWMQDNNDAGADLENVSDDTALLAIQGPKAVEVLQTLTAYPLESIKYYHFARLNPGDLLSLERPIVSRTGYTGEPGFEVYFEAEKADEVWNAIMEAGQPFGLKPAGLGARDTLRLEAGLSLYGNDIDDTTTPLEAGLGWLIKFDKGDFVGRDALERQKREGVPRKLVGFVLEDRGIPRHGYPIVNDTEESIGDVTSGSQSPILEKGIGLGYVPNDKLYTEPGTSIGISVRGKTLRARVAKPPFHRTGDK